MGPTRLIITASRPSNACSRSASSPAGGFLPAGMQRWWICRPTLSFQNSVRSKSRGFSCENRSSSCMTRCSPLTTFSTGSAISDVVSLRKPPSQPLPHRYDENPWKPQQHLAVGLRQIAGRDARGVFGEICFAFGRIQEIDERPQAGSLDPFHDRGGIVERVVIDRVPDLQPAAQWAQRIVIDSRLRKSIAEPCGL